MRIRGSCRRFAAGTALALTPLAYAEPPLARRPEALERALAARSAELLRTARLEYVRHDRAPESRFGPHSYFYSWSAAGDERIATFWGDEEGICVREADGRPAQTDRTQGSQATLLKRGEIWQHRDDSIRADVSTVEKTLELLPRYERFFDMRLLGLDPFGADLDIESHARSYGINQVTYSFRDDGDLVLVSAALPPSGMVFWWIDPQRDYAVVRTASAQDGRRILETEYELEQVDGVWFPRQIDRYRLDGEQRRIKPAFESIEFLTTEFNRPEHPQRFSPADIGVDAGTSVTYDNPMRKSGIWDGGAVVPLENFIQRLKAGEVERGPNVTRVLRQRGELPPAPDEPADAAGTAANSTPGLGRRAIGYAGAAARVHTRSASEWERYTRDFIRRYTLDPAQTERAKSVLKDCEERADKLTADRKEALAQLMRRISNAETRVKASEALSRELQELCAGLRQIFEEQLKPRLDKLPTRAQRDAVANATTQPTKSAN